MIIRFPKSKPKYSVTALDDATARRILSVTKELEEIYKSLANSADAEKYKYVRDNIFDSVDALDKSVTELLAATRARVDA